MITVRPDYECTQEGNFVYYVTYVGHVANGGNVQGWVTVLMPRKVRNVRDIQLLNDTVKGMSGTGILAEVINPVIMTFCQVEAASNTEEESDNE